MNKILIAVIAVVVIAGGAWWLWSERVSAPTTSEVTASDVSWSYISGEDDAGVPQTKVSVTVAGKKQNVGAYAGSCAPVATLADNEISGVLCWYAGGGKEIGVFKDGNKFVVKEGDQDEGSAEEAGFRGNFKTVLTID